MTSRLRRSPHLAVGYSISPKPRMRRTKARSSFTRPPRGSSTLALICPCTHARALARLIDLVYQEVTQVPVDPDKPWQGAVERVSVHSCRGFVDTFSRFEIAQSLVEANDRKVVIAADTLDVEPTERGRVVVGGETLSIVSVRSDPLGAAWEVQARA
jgi:hypothetical protein